MCEKIMSICQNRPLNNFTRFLFMHFCVSCVIVYSTIKFMWYKYLQTIRKNKTRAEKCHFIVNAFENVLGSKYSLSHMQLQHM